MFFNVFSLPLFASAVVAFLLVLFSWRFKEINGAKYFIFLSLAGVIYSLGYALEISTQTLWGSLFWLKIQYIGITTLPAFLILFTLSYTDRDRCITRPLLAVLFFLSLFFMVLVVTLENHEFYYQSVQLNVQSPFPVISFTKGPGYWMYIVYMGAASIFSSLLLFQMWLHSVSMYRRQIAIVLIGSLIPWGANLVYLSFINTWFLDFTPFAFTFSGILFFIGLFRYQLFNLVPIASTALFKQMSEGALVLDQHKRIVDFNLSAAKYLGLTVIDNGKLWEDVLACWPELLSEGEDLFIKNLVEVQRNKDGKLCWFELESFPLKDNSEKVIGQMLVMKEITNRKNAEKALKVSEEHYRILVENANQAIVVYQDEMHKFVNPMAVTLFGGSKEKLLSVSFLEFVHSEDREMVKNRYLKRLNGQDPPDKYNFRIIFEDGSLKWVEISAVLIEWEGNPAVLGLISDITDRKRYEEQLTYLSLHDQLTGLYNYTFFEEELNRLSKSRDYPITIIAADVDGLKFINDTMGHDRGDKLLKICAKVLKKSLRESDILARVGGDEFTVLLPRTENKKGKEIVERIRLQVVRYNKQFIHLPLSISLGIATAKNQQECLRETYKKADDLMYRSKILHGSGARSQIMSTLLAALSERDFITEGHTQRLSKLCKVMGEMMDLSSRQIIDLVLLAQVHDLGKVGIPDHILFKKGPLTEDEWEIMRQHPEKGYRIAVSSPELKEVAELILKHHERWDGNGYPLGIKGKEVPVECRILSIVDAFDAMTNDRPYQKGKSKEEAVEELRRCAGTQFDPELVEKFLSVLDWLIIDEEIDEEIEEEVS
ncbi:histidine kinase N-terminal 7TM domain-containing protein [Candidatus Contubernalis alkaliaceticus]|uniref:histidine kinase N-terminal 7TM domain-containing protein n=1 Tax=Candidatus Contubernalis alkaliaceticus TaxID=338645 RepID=UPI001F4C3E86|nr:histidine kinase N-terminal 7TM domain-containing protein [Candidatus Contubernalis alkalaceticus]UNC93394.1 diguanylate cyclase [Candidatus Contubernalis alkalaceticus]